MILLDHCVARRYLQLLRSWDYDARPMTDFIAADSPDNDVISLATKLDAVLLTFDLDFANVLAYPPENFKGIIVVRYTVADETDIDDTLKSALHDLYREDLRYVLVVITAGRYRIRRN